MLPSLVQSSLLCWAELWWAATQCSSVPAGCLTAPHHTTAHYGTKAPPGHSSQCLNTVPCWAHTHCHWLWSHSPRPQTASEAREGTDIYWVSHTWKHMHTFTHLTYMKMNTHHPIRPDPSQPLSAWAEVTQVTQLLSLTDADDRGVWRPRLINQHQKTAGERRTGWQQGER